MKKQEIKKLSKDQIIKNIDKFKKDLFNFRFQKMNSQITNPAKISETKKTIASCLLYTSPSPRDRYISRMPSSA